MCIDIQVYKVNKFPCTNEQYRMSFQCMFLYIPMNRIMAAVCAWLLPVILMNTKCSMALFGSIWSQQ